MTFEDFVVVFPPGFQHKARLDADLADVYWRAIRAGYKHDDTVALVSTVHRARNPIAVALSVLRDAIQQPPRPVTPRQRAGASRHDPHKPCPDGHPGCVLCGCDGETDHLVALPMPDWFKQAWRDTVRSTVIPP